MFWSWTGYAPRAVAAILGMLVVCLASLTYEDEEGRFQNKLEDWWITLDERRAASLSWAASFIQAVARLTGSCLDRLFSKRLFSLRAVAVSIILSVASFYLTISIIIATHIVSLAKVHNPPSAISALVSFLQFSAFAMIPALSESPLLPWKSWLPKLLRFYWWALFAWVALQNSAFLLHLFVSASNGPKVGARVTSFLLLVFGISLLFDISYIAFTRWILRRVSNTDRLTRIMLAIIFQVTSLAIILVCPFYLGVKLVPYSQVLAIAMIVSYAFNSIDVIAALAALMIAMLMLMHRLIWPLIQRPIYAIQRMTLINRKGWLWSAGVALLTFAVMGVPEWMRTLLERLGR